MRVLVTSTPGLGHVLPLLPVAVELRARRHDVSWLVGPGNERTVAEAGFELTVAGLPERERQAEFVRRYPTIMELPEAERRPLLFSKHFGELAAPAVLEALRPLVASWQPDVIVHDAADLAAPLVGAAAGVPTVCQGFGEIIPEPAVRRAGEEMEGHWAAWGLPPDPYAGSYRGLYVDIYPPSLTSGDLDHVPRVQRRRPVDATPASGDLVYVTFGTLFNGVDSVFRAAVEAAAAVGQEVLVTVGAAGDPGALGVLPAHVTVERFVPQAEVLPRCGAVLSHGGSGTVLAALAHGIPLVSMPRGADQFANAMNVARAGAGVALMGPGGSEGAAVRSALETVLGQPELRAAAQGLAAEIAAMPSDADAAAAIEAHAASR